MPPPGFVVQSPLNNSNMDKQQQSNSKFTSTNSPHFQSSITKFNNNNNLSDSSTQKRPRFLDSPRTSFGNNNGAKNGDNYHDRRLHNYPTHNENYDEGRSFQRNHEKRSRNSNNDWSKY